MLADPGALSGCVDRPELKRSDGASPVRDGPLAASKCRLVSSLHWPASRLVAKPGNCMISKPARSSTIATGCCSPTACLGLRSQRSLPWRPISLATDSTWPCSTTGMVFMSETVEGFSSRLSAPLSGWNALTLDCAARASPLAECSASACTRSCRLAMCCACQADTSNAFSSSTATVALLTLTGFAG